MLPDIPAPFDVDAYCRNTVPAGKHAFDHYVVAVRLGRSRDLRTFYKESVLEGGWESVAKEMKQYVDGNQDLLAEWKKGTELPEACK